MAAQCVAHLCDEATSTLVTVLSRGGTVTTIHGMGDPFVMPDAPDDARVRDAVVIGASGILAPLGPALHRCGVKSVGVARGSRDVGEGFDESVTLDAHNVVAVLSWLVGRKSASDLVVAYAPAVGDAVWGLWRGWAGRLLVVATSQWAAPSAAVPPWPMGEGVSVLQLGWRADGGGWHSPLEVSAAVLEVMAGGFPVHAVLGVVRPWKDQPR